MVQQGETTGNNRWMKSFLSGGIAGVVSKTLIAPIERVKYLFITRKRRFTYRLYMADVAKIVQKHGVINLWRGNLMNVARIFPHAAIDFSVFDYLRSRFYQNDGSGRQRLILFFCGASAGITSLTVTTPLEFVRLRLAMERDSFTYSNNTNAILTILNREGWKGFYRGYGAAVGGITLYHGCSFFVFTRLKEEVKKLSPENYSKWWVDFGLGAVSSVGQLVAYPFDVVRKRMQGQALLLERNQITEMSGYRQLIRDIFHNEEGIKGFYKGISLNLIKAPLSLATVWTVKNYLNRLMDQQYDL